MINPETKTTVRDAALGSIARASALHSTRRGRVVALALKLCLQLVARVGYRACGVVDVVRRPALHGVDNRLDEELARALRNVSGTKFSNETAYEIKECLQALWIRTSLSLSLSWAPISVLNVDVRRRVMDEEVVKRAANDAASVHDADATRLVTTDDGASLLPVCEQWGDLHAHHTMCSSSSDDDLRKRAVALGGRFCQG